MSFSRDGVVWPTEGGWRYGMFEVETTGDPFDEDYDPEWDVEVVWGRFQYVSPVRATPDAAIGSYPGPNPGGFALSDVPCAEYDRMAAAYFESQR